MNTGDQSTEENLEGGSDSAFVGVEELAPGDISSDVVALSESVAELKAELRETNRNMLIGVGVAFMLLVGALVVEISVFHAQARSDVQSMREKQYQEVTEFRKNASDAERRLQSRIDEFRLEFAKSGGMAQ